MENPARYDVTGGELMPAKVREATIQEQTFFNDMSAYTRCPRSAVEEGRGTLVDLRQIDTNKGGLG